MENNKILAAAALNMALGNRLIDLIDLSVEEVEVIEDLLDKTQSINQNFIQEFYQEGESTGVKVIIEGETYCLPADKQILLDMIFEDEKGD